MHVPSRLNSLKEGLAPCKERYYSEELTLQSHLMNTHLGNKG